MNSSVTAVKPGEPGISLFSRKYHRIFITMTQTETCTGGSEENVHPADAMSLCRDTLAAASWNPYITKSNRQVMQDRTSRDEM